MSSMWGIDPGLIYLNHGSFGPTPRMVRESQREWSRQMGANPQEFLSRRFEGLLEETSKRLAENLGTVGDNLIPVENATQGMNLVAQALPLAAGDEVLLTTHEYGAVKRLWHKRSQARGARLVQAPLPLPLESSRQVVEALLGYANERTRLIVVSHVTSPTALVLPVEEICRAARQRGIAVCVDGPHAIAMREVNLSRLDCDFYVASCHKWLSAPLGTGFLYVHPRWQAEMRPCIVSWGGTTCGRPPSWKDEFLWLGTRDATGYLAIPAAWEFLQQYGLEKFRVETHDLAAYARKRLLSWMRTEPLSADSQEWYGSMVSVPLPDTVDVPKTWTGLPHPLQTRLAEQYRIEVPLMKWGHRMYIRVSCHLYNEASQIDRLCDVLRRLL